MNSMDVFGTVIMTSNIAVVMLILLQIWHTTASESYTLMPPDHESWGGLPSPGNMSNASSTRVSLSNGKLMLDSANADFVYGLFPYNPFNASDPNMGSFRTTFNFTTKTASGALGFIIIDPDLEPTTGSNSSKKKLEDRFVTIISLASRRPQFGDSINASSSSGGGYADVNKSSSPYLCVVINYTTVSSGASTIEYVQNIVGEPGLFFFDYKVSLEEEEFNAGQDTRYFTGEVQYAAPPQSENCVPIDTTSIEILCPQDVAVFGALWNSRSGLDLYNSLTIIHSFPNLTQPLPVSRFGGFFAFGNGVLVSMAMLYNICPHILSRPQH